MEEQAAPKKFPFKEALKKIFYSSFFASLLRFTWVSLELYLALILITRSAYLVTESFDGVFNHLFQKVFVTIYDRELIHEFVTGQSELDLTSRAEELVDDKKLVSFLMLEEIEGYFKTFFDNIMFVSNPLRKIMMILKALTILSFVAMMIYHLVLQNFKVKAMKRFFLDLLKIVALSVFLLTGASVYIAHLEPYRVFELGNVFSFNAVRDCFLNNKLIIAIFYGIALRDLLLYFINRPKTPAAPAATHGGH